ncbi:LacI family DNA-binding transcriptional regulator [Rubrobacter taiwanensis]|jgi:LacI family transcriptional regulator|nr:LacI family DNA-binding transcriptional regulator [Rubrobacter taiwanensis]
MGQTGGRGDGRVRGGVTIVDVARRAGVSVSTVSRVMNGRPDVSERTRRQVMEAAAALGYVMRDAARNLASSTQLVAILVQDFADEWMARVLRGVGSEIERWGYMAALFTVGSSRERRARSVEWLAGWGEAAGMLAVLPADGGLLEGAVGRLPVAIVDDGTAGLEVPRVLCPDREGGYRGTKHLLELGHCRIGFLMGIPEMNAARERLAGYRRALAESGVPEGPVVAGDFTRESGRAAGRELLAGEMPTAVFASSDHMALGLIEAVREAGVRVPEDLSVVGYDGLPVAAENRLTTVDPLLHEIGSEAVKLLAEQIQAERPLPAKRVEIPPRLVVRETTAPPGRGEP